jgi:DNA mismatch repair ATPase MutL
MSLILCTVDAIFSLGVRINLMDVVDRKETTLLATTGNSRKLDQTISSVLGSKFLASVAPISIDITSAMGESSPRGEWKLEGFLSKADQNNNGNVKSGQQFFSINGRPVELPKLARAIGDVWRATGAKKKFSCILTLTLPNQEYDVNLSPDKRQVLLTHEAAICNTIQIGVTSFWANQTEGQFTPSASQPSSTPAPVPTGDKPQSAEIPKIDNMESLAKIQESNRKRALELHSQIPTASASSNNRRPNESIDAMDVDDSDGGDGDGEDDGRKEAKRIYMRRCKQEQREQRRLNASGAADLYEKEATTKTGPTDDPVQGESPRLRRRGGFVHDISTAKQWERPSSIDKNFKVPEGIEDPSEGEDDDEAENGGAPAKKPRTGPASPVPTNENEDKSKTNMEQCSSRRVTLSLNNELAEVQLASSTESLPKMNEFLSEFNNSSHPDPVAAPEGSKDCDMVLWVEAQSRFNKRKETNPDRELDILVQTSVSPNQAYRTPNAAERTNKPLALNLEQFAFRNEAARAYPGFASPACQPSIQKPAVSHADMTTNSQSVGSIQEGTARKSESSRPSSRDANSPETDGSGESERSYSAVVWEGFGGTNEVVNMAKLERQRGHERKLRLEKCRPAKNETGNAKISLAKGDFSKMRIIGQFNLGFILATDSRCNLWILDQHACDERANFEQLMANTVMHNQQLIAPMPLELDPSEESCIKDNMQIFEANGFRFQYNEKMPPRHRMALTALPHSGARDGRKAVNFGKDDVSALCAILGARSGSVFEEDDMLYDGGAGSGTGADGSGMYGNNAVRRYAGYSQASATGDGADKVITRLPKAVAMVCPNQ